MARLLAAAAWFALSATTANADPLLTPIIASLLAQAIGSAAVGFTIAGTGITLGALATSLITVAIGVGITLLFAPHPRLPPPENGLVSVQQNIPYRGWAVGRARIAGAIMLKEEIAGYLVYVAALLGHFADDFESLWLNDDEVTCPKTGNNFDGHVAVGADGRYASNVITVHTRQGLATETAYSDIAALLPAQWTSAHRGDGQASIGMILHPVGSQDFSRAYPYAASSPSVVGRWARVYDPRDPAQDPANPATFVWSDNSALAILWWYCFCEFGFRLDYAKAILPVVDRWVEAANDCDDAMALKAGGTEPRYRVGAYSTTEQTRNAALVAMLQTCDGFVSNRGQTRVLQVGKFRAPTVFISDADIVAFEMQTSVGTEDRVNEIIGHWTSPDNGYITVDTTPWIDAVDQAARGGAPRKAELQMSWVQSVGQASRLQKREAFRQQINVRGTLTLNWTGMNAAFERWIGVTSNSIPRLANVVIENRRPVINPKTRTVSIDFILSGAGLDVYDPATDESDPPTIPQRPASVSLPQPSNVTVVPTLISDVSSTSTVILDVSWDEPFFNATPWVLNYIVQYRLTNAGGGSPGSWTQQSFSSPTIAALRVEVTTGPVPIGVSLDVQVASVGTGASLSTYSATVTASTVLANVAPAEPAWISATGGVGSAALSVTSPVSSNFYSVQFYRAAHGSPFSSAVAVGSPVPGSPSSTINYTDTVAAGVYDYFAESLTTSSVASAPAGPESATVT